MVRKLLEFIGGLQAAPARVYLDHAAATPLTPAVVAAMRTAEAEYVANASAIHTEGVAVRRVVDGARAKLARCFGVRDTGVIFTGSGTESNNLAILGAVYAKLKQGIAFADMEVVTTVIEHPSILKTVDFLETLGVVVKRLGVDEEGHVRIADLEAVLTPKTVLVSFAYVNSEVGVIQSVGRLSRVVRAFEKAKGVRIYVHLDAAQAPLWLPCQLESLHVDLMTLDAGKCGGPKGIGVLLLRHGVTLAPVLFGGPQEGGLRPATENVVGIIGATVALTDAQAAYKERASRTALLRDRFIEALLTIEGLVVNGDRDARVANNVNISIPGIDSEFAVVSLDIAGIACSTKSACSGAGGGGSVVVKAMTGDAARATSTIRFTLGPETSWPELERTVSALKAHVEKTLTFERKLVK